MHSAPRSEGPTIAPAVSFARAPEAGRVPALDGLRGLALLAVLAYHVAPSAVGGGFLGVESFFVLSGYLLTTLLLVEHRRQGAIDMADYARRRLCRIAPALLALLATLVVLGPVVAPDDAHRLAGDVISSVAGATNWRLVADASSYFAQAGRPSLVRHLWSVAVEIQFYVVCPFLVVWLCRRRHRVALATLGAGVALSAVIMALLFREDDPSRAYYGTDARLGALLSGVLLAMVLASRPEPRRVAGGSRVAAAVLGPTALAVLVALIVLADDRARWAYPAVFLATQAATAGLIASLRSGPVSRLLGGSGLRWLGVRSFGIYLWHWPAVVLLRPGIDVAWPPVAAAAAGLAVALAMGALSYRVVERPWLRRREPMAAGRRPAAALVSAALVLGVVGLLLRLPTADPLSEALRTGEDILAAQPAPTFASSTSPVTMTVVVPTPALPTTTAPSTTVPPVSSTTEVAVTEPLSRPPPSERAPAPLRGPASVPAGVAVRAIGDSVMVSAAGALQQRLGSSGYIDAQLSRQFADGITAARGVREQGGASVVVIHLGNNGPVDAGDIDAVMSELVDVPAVLFVNVRVSARWRDAVNQTLAEAVGRHPAARLVDWYGTSTGHTDWFQSDGTHFRTVSGPGANAYADLIAGAVAAAVPPPTTTTTTTTAPTTTTRPVGTPLPTSVAPAAA